MPGSRLDRAIDGLARRQHGVFHRRQAVRMGATEKQIRGRLARGEWVRLLDSQVFALQSHPGTWHRQAMAATLSVPGGRLSGPAAAGLLGFPGWPRAHLEVLTLHGTTNRSPFAKVRQSGTTGRLLVVDGIRVVSHADCLVQLAARLDAAQLGALTDEVARTRRNLLPDLRDRYAALHDSRLPGIGALREVLDERGEGHVPPESELDRRLREVLTGIGAEWQVTIGSQRVDAVIPAWRLVVEGDGRAWHTRVADFERDRWRDAEALARGYATLRFTWNQLVHHRAWCRNAVIAAGRHRSGSDRPPRAA